MEMETIKNIGGDMPEFPELPSQEDFENQPVATQNYILLTHITLTEKEVTKISVKLSGDGKPENGLCSRVKALEDKQVTVAKRPSAIIQWVKDIGYLIGLLYALLRGR